MQDLQGTTVHYQIGHALWKTYFSRFANKNKYMIYVIVILAAFVVVYSLCLNQMNAGIGDELMYLLFAAFAAAFVYFFIKFLRGSMPGPQAARYEKQLQQQFGTAALHYTITFESRRLVYCAKESRQKLFIRSVNLGSQFLNGHLLFSSTVFFLLQPCVVQGDGCHGLNHRDCARYNAWVMPPFDAQFYVLHGL